MNVQIFGYIVITLSLIGYFYQFKYTYKHDNYKMFHNNFLLLNSLSCLLICVYTFLVNDIPIFLYNMTLLIFYLFILYKRK